MGTLRKCNHGPVNEIFSSFEQEMALHFEISEIRLVRKANGRVQRLSPGPTPMAGFQVTTYGRFDLTTEARCRPAVFAANPYLSLWRLSLFRVS